MKRLAVLFAAIALCAMTSPAQEPVMFEGHPALKFVTTHGRSMTVPYADYHGAPAFRFNVYTPDGNGWGHGPRASLYVSKQRIALEPPPKYPKYSFDAPRSEIGVVRAKDDFGATIYHSGRAYETDTLCEKEGGGVNFCGYYREQTALIDFMYRCINDFDAAEQEFKRLTASLQPSPPLAETSLSQSTSRAFPVFLSAGKLNLSKGETTTLNVRVTGLDGLGQPLLLLLVNRSPEIVSMQGGDTQAVAIPPQEVVGDAYQTTRTLTGVATGSFSIHGEAKEQPQAAAPPPPPPPPILSLSLQPASVQVYVDDVFKGMTSSEGRLVVEGLAPGSHRVRMNLIGYTEAARTVELKAGETATLEAKLEPAGPKPLELAEIEEALSNGLPPKGITKLVNQYGVDFVLTKEVEQRLRDKGADSDLLVAIATNKK